MIDQVILSPPNQNASDDQNDQENAIQPSNAKQRIVVICNCILLGVQFMTTVAFYLVVPYYVLDTPDHGWTSTDLAVIFSTFNVGVLVGSQSRSIAAICTQNERARLFIGHLSQIIAGIIGWIAVSSIFGFNYPTFVFGCFLLGFNTNCTIVFWYKGIISNGNQQIALSIMKVTGKLIIILNIVFALILPLIFDTFGFFIFCIVLFCVQCIGLLVLLYEWKQINSLKRIRETIQVLVRKQEILEQAKDKIMKIIKSNTTEERVSIPLLKLLSSTMLLLIFVSFVMAHSIVSYFIAFPIVFDLEWNISASTGGYLIAGSNVFSIILLNLSLKYTERIVLFQYPFNIILPIAIFIIGNLMYVIVFEPFIAYSFHLMTSNIISVVSGLEMVARIFVCPPNEFNKITSIIGFLQAIGYLIASSITPILYNIDKKLPFLIMCILNGMLIVVILSIFYQRKSYLSTFYDDINVGNYLQHESKFYERISRSTERRKDLMIDPKTRNIACQIRQNNFDATALLFSPMMNSGQCNSVRPTLIAMASIKEIREENSRHTVENSESNEPIVLAIHHKS